MRRFDVYFLQKRDATGWETLERAQSASVLVSSMVRAFDGEENAELRVVAGDWNETIGEWEFSQIFFVDRSSIDLSLGEPADEDDEPPATAWSAVERDAPEPAETMEGGPGGSFADAIHAAQNEADRTDSDRQDRSEIDTSSQEEPSLRRRADYAEDQATSEDLRSLGFTRASHDDEEPIGPPPDFRPEPRRRGRAFFMIGTVLIALVLILGAAAALMVAFKVDPAPRYIEMLRDWRSGAAAGGGTGAMSDTAVMPQTAGDTVRHAGVADGLQGRWSAGDCEIEYVEFRDDSYVVKAPDSAPYAPVAVSETLEDEYTWYVRRSESLIEHYQKLGPDDIQLIGDTSADGFTQRTSEVFSRCSA
ncbi:MAG: hypothetical protein RLO01_06125 [Thalassobaculaceae bacterium]